MFSFGPFQKFLKSKIQISALIQQQSSPIHFGPLTHSHNCQHDMQERRNSSDRVGHICKNQSRRSSTCDSFLDTLHFECLIWYLTFTPGHPRQPPRQAPASGQQEREEEAQCSPAAGTCPEINKISAKSSKRIVDSILNNGMIFASSH